MTSSPVRVLHLITELRVGGAEIQLARLVEEMQQRPSGQVALVGVACLGIGGEISERIERSGVRVWRLGARGPLGFARAAWSLGALARAERVDVVFAWLYHAMIASCLPGVLTSPRRRVWNIRGTLPGPRDRRGTRLAVWISRLLSTHAAAIIYNSPTAREEHERSGFDSRRSEVIPNGFPVGSEGRPDPVGGGNPGAEPIILLGARFHPMKDFGNFLAALRILRSRGIAVRGRLVGEGCVRSNPQLMALIEESGTDGFLDAVGPVSDVAKEYAGAAVVCSSSAWGEGFQNVIAEAALQGVPVISTDVGEARVIVGRAECLVPPQDPTALAAAIERLLALPAEVRAARARETQERLGRQFGMAAMRSRYESLALRLMGGDQGTSS